MRKLLAITRECLLVLNSRDRRIFWFIVAIQCFLALLDLIGVVIIGIVGSLSIQGIQSKTPQGKTLSVLEFLNISDFPLQTQVTILTLLAVVALLLKTVLSMIFTKRILNFLSDRGSDTASNLVDKLLGEPLTSIHSRDSHDIEYAIGAGLSAITLGVLGLVVTVLSDLTLVLVLFFGVFTIDPLIATTTLLFLGGGGVAFYAMLHNKARILGATTARMNIAINGKISEVLSLYREIYVRNKRSYYADEIRKMKRSYSDALAEQTFMPNISKYAMEISLIISIVIVSAIQFLSNDAVRATASLAVLLAATSRLAPALLRIQQSLVQIQTNIGIAEPTLLILRRAEGLNPVARDNEFHDPNYSEFVPSIKIENISFNYPDSNLKVLNNISLEIAEGTFVAVVGPSGSGKTTLIDILLGMHEPLSGTVQISGLPPSEAIFNWPGAISYVPQSVRLINGTIRENITFGFPKESNSDLLLENSIRSASLEEFVSGLSDGVETLIGKNGIGMSGGQAQRIGIARALFTNPKLLILDEATSALDNETEVDISKSISQLKGKVTLVVIAHRLSTIRKADKVVYLDKGNLVIEGTIDDVRRAVPSFEVRSEASGSEN